jgi:CRISPR-associated protein Csx10
VLRGFFVGKYLRQHPDALAVDLAVDAVARRWFLSGETRWLNAYPLDRLGNRCLPTPHSLNRIKGESEDEIFDLAVNPQEEIKKSWAKVGLAFCQFADSQVRLIEPERQISVHTARTRRYGRARNDKLDEAKGDVRGAVYRCDALAAGQVFEAVVLCDDADAIEIKKLLGGRVGLGKAQNGGYGQAVIEKVSEKEQWSEYPFPVFPDSSDEDAVLSQKLVITLLSDVLLRDDETGQYVVEAEAVIERLQNQLGGSLKLISAFLTREVFGGFNRKWGLPLPQAHAIASGSVFVCEAQNINLKKLHGLLEKGIGERRAEGFGRFAVNWQAKAKLKVDEARASQTSSVTLDGDEAKLAEKVAGRILRHRLDRRVSATGLRGEVSNPPHKSQLARLRGVIQEQLMTPEPSLERVKQFIEELKQRNVTRKQFSQARVGAEKPLDEWLLQELSKTGDSDWAGILNPGNKVKLEIGLGGVSVKPTERMKAEYLLRYLDAFLARAAKQSGKEPAK